MKSVLISIRPKWCELIASGKKTVEVRKTRPKIDTPFKCYIYQTRKPVEVTFSGTGRHISEYDRTYWYNERSGKVIGEFVCDEISGGYLLSPWGDFIQRQTCLTYDEIKTYGKDKPLFFWHISGLKIYDKPKKLSEFIGCTYPFDCCACDYWDDTYLTCTKPIRPPQSWCYVEGI